MKEQKNALRKRMRILKKEVPIEEKKHRSQVIWGKVEQLSAFRDSKVVMAYWSMNDEVYTHDFVKKWAQDKTIVLPAVNKDVLELRIFEGMHSVEEGERYGILEPSGSSLAAPKLVDFIIVPGVAFDRQNNRLGRGKAYYDKLLRDIAAYRVGVCFDFQYVDSVPTDEHDVAVDHVVTD